MQESQAWRSMCRLMPRHRGKICCLTITVTYCHSIQALGGLASRFIIVVLARLGTSEQVPTSPLLPWPLARSCIVHRLGRISIKLQELEHSSMILRCACWMRSAQRLKTCGQVSAQLEAEVAALDDKDRLVSSSRRLLRHRSYV